MLGTYMAIYFLSVFEFLEEIKSVFGREAANLGVERIPFFSLAIACPSPVLSEKDTSQEGVTYVVFFGHKYENPVLHVTSHASFTKTVKIKDIKYSF